MQIFAYSSSTATTGAFGTLIDADTALRWLAVEIDFANGVIESVAAENGVTPQIKADGKGVGVADLSGAANSYPAGLVMTVTFTSGTDMDSVYIDFSSSATSIVHSDPSMQPTVSWTSTPRLATVVQDTSSNLYLLQDTSSNIYLFASPNTPTNGRAGAIEIAVTGAFSESDITSLLNGMTPQVGSGFFRLGFLDGVSNLPDGEAIAVTSRPLLDIDVDSACLRRPRSSPLPPPRHSTRSSLSSGRPTSTRASRATQS